MPIQDFYYFSQGGDFTAPVISVIRGGPADLDQAFGFDFADLQSPAVTLQNIAGIEAGEDFTILEPSGFTVPVSRLSALSTDGQTRMDYVIFDLQPATPGTDWLSIFSVYPGDDRYQQYTSEIFTNFVQNLHIDGAPLGIVTADDTPVVPEGERVLVLGTPQQSFLEARQVHEWRFTLTQGELVRIFMNGATEDLDPVLELRDANGNEMAFDDDSGGGFNSLIRFQAPATAEYVALASFFSFDHAGFYEIGIERMDARAVNGGELAGSMTVQGQITDDAIETLYTFQAQPGDTITITMESLFGDLDSVLTLLNPNGVVIAENDDHDANAIELFFPVDSAIVGVPADLPGTYTIVAGRYEGELGNSLGEFELSLEIR